MVRIRRAYAHIWCRTDSLFDNVFARIVIESKFVENPLPNTLEWSLFKIIPRILQKNHGFAVHLADQMLALALSGAGFHEKYRASGLWRDFCATAARG